MRSFIRAGRLTVAALASAVILAACDGAVAQDLKPVEAYRVTLGGIEGVAFYTVEPDGLRFVATLAVEGSDQVVRMVSTLDADQQLILSVPAEAGAADSRIVFERRGDRLIVLEPQS